MSAALQEAVVVPARLDQLAVLHATLSRFWEGVDRVLPDGPDELWRLTFATAVAEIGTNIVQHAYTDACLQGEIGFRLRLCFNGVEARFIDHGAAFLGKLNPPSPLESVTLSRSYLDVSSLPESGYGLVLVQGLVDKVQYRRIRGCINCWRLLKHFSD